MMKEKITVKDILKDIYNDFKNEYTESRFYVLVLLIYLLPINGIKIWSLAYV